MDANPQVSSDESTTKVSNNKVPRVIANEPDHTFSRYVIDKFKTKASGSKSVPFESIDPNLYKPKAKLVGFRTSEDRIALWIEAITTRYIDSMAHEQEVIVTWEELESYANPGKPDKIVLSVRRKDEKLFVLSVFITTGRIQVQGAYHAEWSTKEFPLLMKIINKITESGNSSPDLTIESQECLFPVSDEEETESETESEDEEEDEEEDEDELKKKEWPTY